MASGKSEKQVEGETWDWPDMDGNDAPKTPQATGVDIQRTGGDAPVKMEMLEKIHQEAYEEGFALGKKEGLAKGFDLGREEGLRSAEATYDFEMKPRVLVLARMMQELSDPIADAHADLHNDLIDLVMYAVQQVVFDYTANNEEYARQLIDNMCEVLPMNTESVKLHVSPEDREMIEMIMTVKKSLSYTWELIEDESLNSGGVRLESAHTTVDGTLESRFDTVCERLKKAKKKTKKSPAAKKSATKTKKPSAKDKDAS